MPVRSREFCHGYFGRAGQICSAHVDHDDRAPIRQRGAQDDRSCQGNACGCQPGSVSWSWCHWSPNSAPSSARPAPSRQVRSSAVRERAGRCSRPCASASSRRSRWSWCGLTCGCRRCSAISAGRGVPAGGGQGGWAPSLAITVGWVLQGNHPAASPAGLPEYEGFRESRRGPHCIARHCIPLLIAHSNRGHCW